MTESVEKAWNAQQVADYLGLHLQTVYERAWDGRIPSFKVGNARRFRPEEIRALKERGEE